jgi:hypothetical protein
MFGPFMSLLKANATPSHRTPSRRTSRRRLKLEQLEGRQLFAVGTQEVLVNAVSSSDQTQVAIASVADGRSVAVWTHSTSSSNTDIRAQRFDSNGNKAGGEIVVAASTRLEETPDVAMKADGSFFVTWVDHVTSSNRDVKALRFSDTGAVVGRVVNVAITAQNEIAPSIAMASNGIAVITWEREASFNRIDVFAHRYSNFNTLLNQITVANSSTVNERSPDVAMSPDGRFAISYSVSSNAISGDIFVQRYNSSAAPVGGSIAVAQESTRQLNPRISMDDNANAVVVWNELVISSDDVKARRVSNGGVMSGVFTIVSASNVNEIAPDIAYNRAGTAFVVTYYNNSDKTAQAVEMTSTGAVRNRSKVADQASANRVAVVFGSGNNYRVAYSRRASGFDVFQKIGVLS